MAFYRTLTIDHTKCGSADSTSFTVGVIGTYSWLATVANGGKVTSSSGYDILFCTNPASPLSTILPFERVVWKAATGVVEFYVQVPTLSASSDTVIYIYYGDSAITTDQQDVSGSWDANFVAVYHFGDGTTLSTADSTSNANNGTNHGATAAAGDYTPGAASFSGSEYIAVGTPTSLNITGALSIDCVINASSLPGSGVFPWLVGKGYPAGVGYDLLLHDSSGDNSHTVYMAANAGGSEEDVPPAASSGISASTPYVVSGRYTSGTNGASLWRNRADVGGSPTTWSSAPGNSSAVGLNIGVNQALTSSFYWQGLVDELRISNVKRSDSWETATYNNLSAASSFYAFGVETSTGGGGGGSGLIINPGMEGGMHPQLLGGCNG